MAENKLLDTASGINNLSKVVDLTSKLSGGQTLGTGGLLPGAIPAYQGPGMGAAVASSAPSLATMAPFLGLAGLAVTNMLTSKLADKPSVMFSGLKPRYGVGNGRYTYQDRERKALQPVSDKYDYYLTVSDTGKDPEIAQQYIQYFDNMFDQLSAQGVPVNDMLARNQNFYFGGSLLEPEKMLTDIQKHFQPDIEAYESGRVPEERTIQVDRVGPRADGLSGRDAYDLGLTNDSKYIQIGQDGIREGSYKDLFEGNGRLITSFESPEKRITGGVMAESKFDSAEEKQVKALYKKLFDRDNPETGGVQYWAKMLKDGTPIADIEQAMSDAGKAYTKQDDGSWVHNDTGQRITDTTPSNYQYNQNSPDMFEDFVNNFYDRALGELQKQSGQFEDNTNEYSERSQGLLGQGQGYLDKLISEVEGNSTRKLPTVSRMVGGQKVTWSPKPNRDAAMQDTNAALGLFDRQGKFIDTGLNEARQDFSNKQVLASAGNPTLNYLDKLKELVSLESAKQAGDKGLTLDRDRLNAQVEGSEPGMLDYAMGIGTLASGVGNLAKGLDGNISNLLPWNW